MVAGSIEKKEEIYKNVSVVFTKDGETADSYIEREVHNIGRKYEVYVVTSDWLQQQIIFQRGAVRISSIEFYNEVLKTQNKITNVKSSIQDNVKNNLGDNLEEDIIKKFEAWRRGK